MIAASHRRTMWARSLELAQETHTTQTSFHPIARRILRTWSGTRPFLIYTRLTDCVQRISKLLHWWLKTANSSFSSIQWTHSFRLRTTIWATSAILRQMDSLMSASLPTMVRTEGPKLQSSIQPSRVTLSARVSSTTAGSSRSPLKSHPRCSTSLPTSTVTRLASISMLDSKISFASSILSSWILASSKWFRRCVTRSLIMRSRRMASSPRSSSGASWTRASFSMWRDSQVR